MKPWDFVPSVGKVEIVRVDPGDADVLIGSSLDILVEVKNPGGEGYEGKLFLTAQGEPESVQALTPDDKKTQYRAALATIAKPLKYRVEIGDSQSRIYEIQVRQKPTIEEVKVKFHYPEYLDRADETVTQKDADLTAPQYTVAALEIRPSTAVAEGYLELEGRKLSARSRRRGNWWSSTRCRW